MPAGTVAAAGITQFVVGTGGHELMGFAKSDARVATRISGVDGALKLTLSAAGASYQFVGISGSVLDSGTVPCQTGTAEPTATPTSTATPVNSGSVVFSPMADARVDEAQPTKNMGTSSSLRADAGAGANVESRAWRCRGKTVQPSVQTDRIDCFIALRQLACMGIVPGDGPGHAPRLQASITFPRPTPVNLLRAQSMP